ncbi:hypothetical protein [Streptomyces sp. NPDC051016]|uniref:hypothetical protein n=1 Tax=Streptomyces sp. NPDC051016 TaxID=3365638 RepID=UPI0037B78B65
MSGRASNQSSSTSRCPSCSAPILTQWVGDTAALKAIVDLPAPAEPRPYGPAAAVSTPHDLVWCLPRPHHGPLRLRWTNPRHPPNCPHQHLTTHHCATAPSTLF